jgi:predicted nuclease with TOPRIM domain
LEQELALVGATSVEIEKQNTLRELSADATNQQREAVVALIDQIEAERQRIEELEEAERKLQERINAIADAVGFQLSGAFDDLITGQLEVQDFFASLAREVANLAFQIIVLEPLLESMRSKLRSISTDGGFDLGSLFSGGGGGIGGLFSSLFGFHQGGSLE